MKSIWYCNRISNWNPTLQTFLYLAFVTQQYLLDGISPATLLKLLIYSNVRRLFFYVGVLYASISLFISDRFVFNFLALKNSTIRNIL